MIRRYLLFAGDRYYPAGGWNDFVDSFDTKEEALERAWEALSGMFDWYHIIDHETGEEVASSGL